MKAKEVKHVPPQKLGDRSIDVASFKKILDIQKNDMQMFLDKKAQKSEHDRTTSTAEWKSFFTEAVKQSRKKKRNISLSKKRNEKLEKDRNDKKLRDWLNLYNNRLQSDEAYEEYCMSTMPPGAWSYVD